MSEDTKWLIGIFFLILVQICGIAYVFGASRQQLRDLCRRVGRIEKKLWNGSSEGEDDI